MKIEILGIIVIIVLLLLWVISLKNKSDLMKDNNDLIYQLELTYQQLEHYQSCNFKLESENAKLHSSIQNVKNECSFMVDDIKDSYDKMKRKNISLIKRINNISADNGLRNVIGSRYKVGDALYHTSPKSGSIIKKSVIYIELVDYGTEYEVTYGFASGGSSYTILEDSCFKDKETAQMFL